MAGPQAINLIEDRRSVGGEYLDHSLHMTSEIATATAAAAALVRRQRQTLWLKNDTLRFADLVRTACGPCLDKLGFVCLM